MINEHNKYLRVTNITVDDLKYVAKKGADANDERVSHIYRDLNFNNDIFVKILVDELFEQNKIYSYGDITNIIHKYKKELISSLNLQTKRDYMLSFDYYTKCGWNIKDTKMRIYDYAHRNKFDNTLMYTLNDIRDYIIKENPYNMNLDNMEFINNFINEWCNIGCCVTHARLFKIFKKFANTFYAKIGKSATDSKGYVTIYKEYYLARGYNEDEATKLVSDGQKVRSARTIEHYIHKGMSYEDDKNARSDTQRKYYEMTKYCYKFWMKRGYDEETAREISRKINFQKCAWGYFYWMNKGYTKEEAYEEICKRNSGSPKCGFYHNDLEFYQQIMNDKFFHRTLNQKIRAAENVEKYKEIYSHVAVHRASKIENRCFEFLRDNVDGNIKHEPYIVVFPKTYVSSSGNSNYFACDGYLQSYRGFIIIEYDSAVFHKNDEDIERDTEIFYLDDSIVGILRITQQFYTSINSSNKENKIEIINFALEEIESRVCDRIVINDEYESYAKKRIEELK